MSTLAMTHTPRRNPYVGPRAFQTGEVLYGRDGDVLNLYYLLLAERVVLLFSPSGAGKSSLIQAGLIPRLREKFGFISVIRVNQEPPEGLSSIKGFNRYIFSALLSLEETVQEGRRLPAENLATLSLSAYLTQRVQTEHPQDESAKPVFEALIFDQFEEILTTAPNDYEPKIAFFDQLGDALRDTRRWALFSVREDYAAAFEPYLRAIPTRFANRYRLDLLDAAMALEAIQKPPQEMGVEFSDAAARKLVDDLRHIQTQRPDGTTELELGRYVEPVQLQVVCFRLWQGLSDTDVSIDETDLADVGDVNRSLADYYSASVKRAAEKSTVSERVIREWFDRKLITPDGIRGQVLMGAENSEGLPNLVVRLIEDAHIIRGEKRAGKTWYELSHDRMIKPVREDNAAWFAANLSLFQRQADLWEKQKRPDGLLLRGKALTDAEQWTMEHVSDLTEIEQDFLAACRKARAAAERERRNNRLIRILAVAALIGLIVASIATVIAGLNARQAEEQRVIANQNAQRAEEQARIATYRQLGAKSIARQADRYDLALLLSLETARIGETISDTFEGRNSLSSALENNPQLAGFLSGHTAAVKSVAFSPDGQMLASGSADNSIILWDMANHQPIGQALTGHTGEVLSVAFSPDDTLASGSADNSIILWDVANRQPIGQPLTGHTGEVLSVAFSPDGTLLASGSSDGSIILWDAASHQPLGEPLTGHTSEVLSVAFSPDGETLASGDADGDIIVWNIGPRTPTKWTQEITDYAGSIYSLAFSPDGQTLASGNGAGTIFLWDVPSQRPRGEPLKGHTDWVLSVAFNPDGSVLASGSYDGSIIVWDVASQRPVGEPLIANTSGVNSVAFSPNGQLLASGNDRGDIILWQPGNQLQDESLSGHSNAVNSVAFSPDGKILASGSADYSIILWDANTHQMLGEPLAAEANCSLRSTEGSITTTIAFVNSSERVVTVNWLDYEGKEQPYYEMQPGETIPQETYVTHPWCVRDKESNFALSAVVATPNQQTITIAEPTQAGHTDQVLSVAFSPDGKTLATGSADNSVILWDVANRQPIGGPLTGHIGGVLSVAFSPDGKMLASGSGDGIIILWDIASRQPIGEPLTSDSGVRSVAFSSDGKTLASGSNDGSIIFWDAASHQPIGEPFIGHTGGVLSVAFSPAGKTLASGSGDKSIRLWDVASRQPLGEPLTGHTSEVFGVAFSPDGHTLASGSMDKNVILWDVASRERLGTPLSGHSNPVFSVAFSPNGQTLASGSGDTSIILWNVDLESWKDRACQIAGRNLTQAEWQQYLGERNEPYRKTCEQWPEGN